MRSGRKIMRGGREIMMDRLSGLINFDEKGLIPAVIQDAKTKKVLTLCYMNKEALERTFAEKRIYLFRRSRGMLMMKGQTSGCVQKVREAYIDCEGNSLLFLVDQVRAACHEGYFTCYFRKIGRGGRAEVKFKRVFDPGKVYR
jgi:phosphoribosyl-AMP cyclohydrolase